MQQSTLNLPFRAFTTDAGVDILSFGGTKNGMMYGEAVCFLRPGISVDFKYIRKQGMQLASKMRFISAQYIAYFRNDLWKSNALHSNSMALLLAEKLEGSERDPDYPACSVKRSICNNSSRGS